VLPWTDIKAIGVDAVTVQSENVLQNEKDAAGAEDSTRASSLLGARVMTENGKELGTVHDVDLDMAAGRITGFTLPGNLLDRLQHHPHLVPITGVRSVGDGLIVVANEVAHALT
jgi:sporulation protein YlmC with PRC-barrel domain